MDPQITHMMPVLNSPLLSLHVSIIMMSYALVSLTFICGIVAILLKGISKLRGNREKTSIATQMESLAVLSRIFLYPALTTMGLGIFIGAIWANVSWGNYWSWDPKETWALITFMVYAVVVHTQSLPIFRRPLAYHIYMVLAFLTILMTYFGVNYFLGGMHSYA
jgi:ABC-type transport system involved in cytochrome c biogenesis permease subunit